MAEKQNSSEAAWYLHDDDVAIVYADGIDWQHHTLGDSAGTKVYRTAEDCREANPCTVECGIVQLEMRVRIWVEPQHFVWPGREDEGTQ